MRAKMVVLGLLCLFLFSLLMIGQSYAKIDKKNAIGIWLLDEGTGNVARDSSGNGNNGAYKGNPKWVAGKFGKALEITSAGTGVQIDNPENFNFTTWTYVLWFKTPAGGDYPNLVGRQFANAHGWTIHLDPGRATFRIRIDTDGGINQVKTVPGAVGKDEWHHGAICQDDKSKQLTFYFDGVKGTSSYAGNYKNSGGFMTIALACVGAVNLTAGSIDEVGVFDAILTEDDVKLIMEKGLEASVPGLIAVSSNGKLTGTWGQIKSVN